MNNKMQFEKVAALVDDAKKQPGVKIECGGGSAEGRKGYFFAPTIISNVAEGVRIVDEEQFGPVMPVIRYTDDEDALQRANNSPYGLGGSVWSKDVRAAASLGARMQAGTVWINEHTALTGAPFGGFKESGVGRELGREDVRTYTECQTMKVPATNGNKEPAAKKPRTEE